MTEGGVVLVLVTVTVPSGLVMTRIGATTRAVAERVVEVEVPVVVAGAVVDVDAAVVAVVVRKLPSGGLAARVGLALTDDVSVGVRIVLLAPVATEVVVGPAAN